MGKTNGKSDVETKGLDIEHELPPSDDTAEVQQPTTGVPAALDELQKLKAERDTLLERLARLQAEFENARKRSAREQTEYRDYALVEAIKTLLPILDSFDRALQAGGEGVELRSGIELINKQLHDALAKMGLRPIRATGGPFDPHLHQAIEMVDTDDVEDHHVLEELQKGYKFKDRLLRPSMVRVARNSKS